MLSGGRQPDLMLSVHAPAGPAPDGSALASLALQGVRGHEPNSGVTVGQQAEQLWHRRCHSALIDGFAASRSD
jgi:hypothetical protein